MAERLGRVLVLKQGRLHMGDFDAAVA
jgi:hypothetical protein